MKVHNKGFTPFGGLDHQTSNIDGAGIVVLPLCYEHAPSYGTGSREGPCHILEASVQLEEIDEEALVDWSAPGIHTVCPISPAGIAESAVQQMQAAAAPFMEKGKFLLCLGGDHAVSIGPITAASKIFSNLGVLQIDAHLDLRSEYNNSRYNHACVMRRVVEDAGLPITQVGIRSFSKEELDYITARGFEPFFAHQIDPMDNEWMDRVVCRLPENVYLTIDLDGLDPAAIPGTGTPEPGGLSYRQVVDLIKILGKKKHIVAADITELAKMEGTQVSEFTAARIAAKLFVFGYICPRWKNHP